MFIEKQPEELKNSYVGILQAVGSMSRLFSDYKIPYLYYRAAENAFCLAFNADNLSRGDTSADAQKNGVGVGLKTFTNTKSGDRHRRACVIRFPDPETKIPPYGDIFISGDPTGSMNTYMNVVNLV